MPYWFEPTSVSVEVGGRTMTIETGKIAKQAAGAALVTYGALLGGELTYFNGAGVILD